MHNYYNLKNEIIKETVNSEYFDREYLKPIKITRMHCIILKNKSVMLNKSESIISSVLHVLMNDLQFVTVYNLTCLYSALGQHKILFIKETDTL